MTEKREETTDLAIGLGRFRWTDTDKELEATYPKASRGICFDDEELAADGPVDRLWNITGFLPFADAVKWGAAIDLKKRTMRLLLPASKPDMKKLVAIAPRARVDAMLATCKRLGGDFTWKESAQYFNPSWMVGNTDVVAFVPPESLRDPAHYFAGYGGALHSLARIEIHWKTKGKR